MTSSPSPFFALDAPTQQDAAEAARLTQLMLIQYRDAFVVTTLLIIATLSIGYTLYTPTNGESPRNAMPIQTSINPNTAGWYELAQLPGIGEGVAKKIVAYRDSRKVKISANAQVFHRPSDLLPINGIGTKMLQRISPFLSFAPPTPCIDSPNERR